MLGILKRHLPKGWHVKERPEGSTERGSCVASRRTVYVPNLVTRSDLYVGLHECAHARLKHQQAPSAKHVDEYEAEMLAIAFMRLEGIPVPVEELRRAKADVAKMMAADVAKGWRAEPAVKRWCGL